MSGAAGGQRNSGQGGERTSTVRRWLREPRDGALARLLSPQLWLGLFSAAVVLYLVSGDMGEASPGPVATVHARVDDLDGGNHCASCHGGWFSDMTASCLECHEAIGQQVEADTGLHGGMISDEQAGQCALCHSDHHGADFAMVNARTFALAGVADVEQFDHDLVGFEMRGVHLEAACSDCHLNAAEPVLPEGEARYLGLEAACASCHQDPHDGQMRVDCTSCHSQDTFYEQAFDSHDQHLPLSGGHADLTCRECHAHGDAHSLESHTIRLAAGRETTGRVCADCHESPHGGDLIASVAAAASRPEGESCVQCHEAEHMRFRQDGVTLSLDQHAAAGFHLDRPHHEVACTDCHDPAEPAYAERYPGRGQDDCHACHDDPHGGQFAAGPFADGGCVACHERQRFTPHAFSPEKHARTGLALAGTHLELSCHQCHSVPGHGGPRVFHGTPDQCSNCHEDAHRGYFDRFATELTDVKHGSCARCHLTTHFEDVAPEEFDHARWTGFPLAGAHAQNQCESCHPRAESADAAGRRFGIASEHFGRVEGCQSCHRDPHQGLFDLPHQPKQVEGATDCARCHGLASFRSLPFGFDHTQWTGFALEGAHGELGCSSCHTPLRRPDELGRTWGRARGQNCASCHRDPHVGQFERNQTTDCSRCHKDQHTFSRLSFRHDLDSRFRLGEPHRRLACAACHQSEQHGDSIFVRYRPLGTNCVDCHGAHRQPLRRRRR
ncbi:MAG: hypothetical protein AAF628_10130 [Planctomycetota bacterium]